MIRVMLHVDARLGIGGHCNCGTELVITDCGEAHMIAPCEAEFGRFAIHYSPDLRTGQPPTTVHHF